MAASMGMDRVALLISFISSCRVIMVWLCFSCVCGMVIGNIWNVVYIVWLVDVGSTIVLLF